MFYNGQFYVFHNCKFSLSRIAWTYAGSAYKQQALGKWGQISYRLGMTAFRARLIAYILRGGYSEKKTTSSF